MSSSKDEIKSVIGIYRKGSRLGSGSYGTVYAGKNRNTGAKVAIKKQRYSPRDGFQSALLREIVALSELKHPNIVALLDLIIDRSRERCWLILERMDLDLNAYLCQFNSGESMAMDLCQSYLLQLLSGVQFCHARGIVHSDLKPQNLLINGVGDLKIADFGIARLLSGQHGIADTAVATLWYRSPEMLLGSPVYDTALDMWSVGCIFAEMLQKSPVFPGDSAVDTLYLIFRVLGTVNETSMPGVSKMAYYRDNFPNWTPALMSKKFPQLSASGLDLLNRFLCYTDRISASEALRHPWLKENANLKNENDCCLN